MERAPLLAEGPIQVAFGIGVGVVAGIVLGAFFLLLSESTRVPEQKPTSSRPDRLRPASRQDGHQDGHQTWSNINEPRLLPDDATHIRHVNQRALLPSIHHGDVNGQAERQQPRTGQLT